MEQHETDLNPRLNYDNPDPRVACAILVDISGSMGPEYRRKGDERLPIEELNRGLREFAKALDEDGIARRRAEIELVTFGGHGVRVEPSTGFVEGRDWTPPELEARGGTPLVAAIERALVDLENRKQAYKQAGLEYYRPWLFILSDGQPSDPQEEVDRIRKRLRAEQEGKHLVVFAVGTGEGADIPLLDSLCAANPAVMLDETKFGEMFTWLSASLSDYVGNTPAGASDDDIENKEAFGGQQAVPLKPLTWTAAPR